MKAPWYRTTVKIANTFFEGEDDYDKYDRRENMVGYNFEHMFDNGWSVRQKLRYLHTKVELNQVYAAGWLNESELNRGYSGSDEKMNAITLDNQLDGSVDTWAVNHRLLLGIDYQDRSNNTTGYYGAFPAIDAFNPVYGAKPDYITMYSREKHKLRQTGYYLQDQMSWERWRFTSAGATTRSACRISISSIKRAAIWIRTTSAPAPRCCICSITGCPVHQLLHRLYAHQLRRRKRQRAGSDERQAVGSRAEV